MSMSDEELRAQSLLIESIQELTRTVAGAGGNLGSLSSSARNASTQLQDTAKVTADTSTRNRRSSEDEWKAKANLNTAIYQATSSVKEFATAFTKTTSEFSTFNGSIKSAGDAAASLSKNIPGILGKVAGLVIKGATEAAMAATKQADNILKASDELSKMGAVGGFTSKEILQMGHNAGLTSANLDLFVKATKSLGTATLSLGSNAKEGIKEFAKAIDYTSAGAKAQVDNFRKLGISQDELRQNTADFIVLQQKSGVQISARMKQEGGLQKAAFEYTKNLLELSSITGQDVESAKKLQEEAQVELTTMIQANQMQQRLNELYAKNTPQAKAEAEILEKEIAVRKQLNAVIADTKDKELLKGFQTFMSSGTLANEFSTKMLRLVPNLSEFRARAMKGDEKAAVDLQVALKAGINARVKEMGDTFKIDEATAREFGVSVETLQWATKNVGEGSKGVVEGAAALKDPAQENRVALINSTQAIDKMKDAALAYANPILNHKVAIEDLMKPFKALDISMDDLTLAAGLAADALLLLAGLDLIKNLAGMAGITGGKVAVGAGRAAAGAAAAGVGATAAGALAAGVGGYMLGDQVVNPYINKKIQQATGVKDATLGTWLYDKMNPSSGASATASTGGGGGGGSAETSGVGGSMPTPAPMGTVQGLLDFIAQKESKGDYNIMVGGKRANLTDMTVQDILQLQNQMKRGGFESTALGKYQIIQSTLLGTMGKAGVALTDKFDQATQDKLGMALLKGRGLDQYLAKKMSPEKFADQLAMEWASMPYNTGASYYDKVGSNKSLVGRQAFVEALPKARTGGVFSGSDTGFPVELHGNELVAPLDPNSILAKMLTASPSEAASMMNGTGSSGVSSEMIEAMIYKFDTMISYLSEGVDIQQKILRQS